MHASLAMANRLLDADASKEALVTFARARVAVVVQLKIKTA